MASSGDIFMDYESNILAMAILAGDTGEVQSLVNVGVTITQRYQWTLYQACLNGNDMIRALLASPEISFDIDIPDDGGDSIIHFVLRTPTSRFLDGKTNVVRLLLENGADPFRADHLQETALHILAGIPKEEENHLLEELVSRSGSLICLNDQNYYGDTALNLAIACRNFEAARALLEAGANPDIEGERGMTAVEHAVQTGDVDMINLLLSFGAKLPKEFSPKGEGNCDEAR